MVRSEFDEDIFAESCDCLFEKHVPGQTDCSIK